MKISKMLEGAYLLAKIGADTAENEQHVPKKLPIGRRVAAPSGAPPCAPRRLSVHARLAGPGAPRGAAPARRPGRGGRPPARPRLGSRIGSADRVRVSKISKFCKILNFAKFCKFLAGSFSAVSKRNFARKYAFDSIFQALQDLHTFAPLQSQNFRKKSV